MTNFKILFILLHVSLLLGSDAFIIPKMSNDHVKRYSSATVSNQDEETECPFKKFSMKYKRYRVPVSSTKENPSYKVKGGILDGIKTAMDKSVIEKKYAIELNAGSFLWIEPDIDVSQDEERIAKGKLGLFASSIVWKTLAENIENLNLGESKRIVLALPKMSTSGLNQLADIINWYASQGDDSIFPKCSVGIVVDVDDDTSVPVVIFDLQRNSSETLSQRNLSYEEVIGATQSWVKRVLVEMSICPFTKSVTKSGQGLGDLDVPVANIAYHHSKATKIEIPRLMADTWGSIYEMIKAGDHGKNGISSILLSAPNFDDEFPLFAGPIFAMLESNVSAAFAEPLIGVVCFHPKYKTPDGGSFPGFGQMHSLPRLRKWLQAANEELSSKMDDENVAAGGAYQRRTPYATINVLRAEQLEKAESKRVTADLYARNIDVLNKYGYDNLEKALEADKVLTS